MELSWTKFEDEFEELTLEGQLNSQSIAVFRKEIERFFDNTTKDLYLEMSRLIHLDSVGMGVLIFFHTQFQSSGRKVVFKTLSDEIENLFELTSLNRVLNIA